MLAFTSFIAVGVVAVAAVVGFFSLNHFLAVHDNCCLLLHFIMYFGSQYCKKNMDLYQITSVETV